MLKFAVQPGTQSLQGQGSTLPSNNNNVHVHTDKSDSNNNETHKEHVNQTTEPSKKGKNGSRLDLKVWGDEWKQVFLVLNFSLSMSRFSLEEKWRLGRVVVWRRMGVEGVGGQWWVGGWMVAWWACNGHDDGNERCYPLVDMMWNVDA